MQDKLDPKLWTEFDRVVEQGDAPKVSIETLKVIRNATPVERLAGWLMKAWFPLFLIFLGFLLLHEHSSPTEIARATRLENHSGRRGPAFTRGEHSVLPN